METECYPCIPMHSASNQKRMNHSTVTMIKPEPLSEDVNVVVDDESEHHRNSRKTRNRRSLIANPSSQQHRIQQHTIRLSRVGFDFQNFLRYLLQRKTCGEKMIDECLI